MLVPLELPPGVHSNGTDLQSSGRWLDANLVRWMEGTMRPVQGWQERASIAAAPPRAAIAWQDLTGNRHYAAGTYNGLYVATAANVVTDITPADLTAGNISATINTGFGGGFFGLGYYGTERPAEGEYGEATTWALDTFGQDLIACSVADGRILRWDLNPVNKAAPIAGAPVDCLSVMVTDERFVMALGAGGNPRKVQWSDREDAGTWAPASTNEAGDIELQTNGQIMCGLRTRGQALILTDQDAHVATYQGPPYVYGFERIGTSCGVVSRKAAAMTDRGAFWMGARSFFTFTGGAVQEVPCEVSDYVFNDINRAQQSKAFAVTNSQFGEVWWFYPGGADTECTRYVAYSFKEGHWAVGHLARSCGIDRGIFRRPLFFSTDGTVYNHEIGLNYDGAEVYAESGPVTLGEGIASVTQLIPDEQSQGDVAVTFKTRFHPNDTERDYGPYSMGNPTSVRFTGRQVRMRVSGAKLADWRWGVPRLEVSQRGKR